MNRREVMIGMGAAAFTACPEALADIKTRAPLKGYIRTNWSVDPFAYGSYSHIAKGSGDSDRALVAEPIGDRVHFGGEALNPNYQSTVHAAYDSGLANAHHILSTPHRRIAIIGAGAAGLSAAHFLAEQGCDVTVYEARDRIGGRIWTDRSLGLPLDKGASWIHGPIGNPITKLADTVGAERIKTGGDFVVRGRNGRRILSLFAPKWALEGITELSMGATWGELNQQETDEQYEEYGVGYEGPDVKFPGGYDQIFEALSGDYDVQLSTEVTQIAYTASGVTLHSVDGPIAEADAVLVTVSLGVLKRGTISFDPPLSVEKTAAISRMGMGVLDKLYLLFEEPFWDKNTSAIITPYNDLPMGHFNHWINFDKYFGQPIIMAFNYGPYARELSTDTDEQLLTKALQTLAMAYPV